MKYNIENNIDFYQELYSSLSEESEIKQPNNNGIENIELCLITNLPLKERFVELKCGHKFNYGPLYKDILNHKKKFNNMEQVKTKLKYNEIRCPYCRNVQNELLPYYEDLSYPKEHGVNFFDNNKINSYCECINANNQCQYESTFVDNENNSQVQPCFHYGYTHYVLKTKYNNSNKYCYSHKVIVLNETKEKIKQEKQKEKLEIKQKKLEEKNKLKEELKEKKLNEKLVNKSKQTKQNNTDGENDDENIILVNSISINNSEGCIQILKTGNNKGLQCGNKVCEGSFCKRHFNLHNKIKDIKDIKI
jgi:hypothetical protein